MFAKFICWFFAPLFNDPRFMDCVVDQIVRRGFNVNDLSQMVANRIGAKAVANQLVDSVVEAMDTNEVAQRTAHLISASEVADFVDTQEVAEHIHVDASTVAEEINIADLVRELDQDRIAERVCEHVSKDVDYSKLAEEVDMSNLCAELDYSSIACALEVDYSELASNFDTSDIAGEITVDYSDLAGEISYSELVGELEYEDIASHVCAKSVAQHCTKQINDAVYDYLSNDDMIDYKALAKAIIKELASPKVEVRTVCNSDKPFIISDKSEVNA